MYRYYFFDDLVVLLLAVLWIRRYIFLVTDPEPGKNEEKPNKLSKFYFFFAWILQKIQWNVFFQWEQFVGWFIFVINNKA